MKLSIKPKHRQTVVGFGTNGLPLGRRSQSELIDLAILARQSNDKSLSTFFEELPKLEDLQKAKTDAELQKA